jgi:hypothetical protein
VECLHDMKFMNDIANALDWKPQNNDQNSFTDIWEFDS